jgi:hypothetical protein
VDSDHRADDGTAWRPLKDSPDRSGIGGDSLDVSANFSSESFGQHVFNIQFFPSFGPFSRVAASSPASLSCARS